MRMWIEILQTDQQVWLLSVILYMRMWIEIFFPIHFNNIIYRHPLYEDVNWNILPEWNISYHYVILYMRMWIEICSIKLISSSDSCHPLYEDVNWNSRLLCASISFLASSSIWGCELKFFYAVVWNQRISHPLYEDVNWNKSVIQKPGRKLSSSSIWGCELKFLHWSVPNH